ncbi:hypothetical protein D8674_003956 [Pyrus ussuriensis x Pyrus communis]|uniref:Uncharacterized protein n=1 Tax=Pyrus ussuriensis x Pyrus communis TaxID=2448454 RepID=A0A5N5FMP9_9ROSA|nr:hypothetical protein D8674_003956 [Pyrus ussuriensis x Pyrus communis]
MEWQLVFRWFIFCKRDSMKAIDVQAKLVERNNQETKRIETDGEKKGSGEVEKTENSKKRISRRKEEEELI